jgi:hypothetical protein
MVGKMDGTILLTTAQDSSAAAGPRVVVEEVRVIMRRKLGRLKRLRKLRARVQV